MNSSPRSTSFALRCALVAAVACTSLLLGCDRGRQPATAGPGASASAASGVTR